MASRGVYRHKFVAAPTSSSLAVLWRGSRSKKDKAFFFAAYEQQRLTHKNVQVS